jgi:hypothetical protein
MHSRISSQTQSRGEAKIAEKRGVRAERRENIENEREGEKGTERGQTEKQRSHTL